MIKILEVLYSVILLLYFYMSGTFCCIVKILQSIIYSSLNLSHGVCGISPWHCMVLWNAHVQSQGFNIVQYAAG